MKDVLLKLEKITITHIDPKQGIGQFVIHFSKDQEKMQMKKSYTLHHPEPIVENILKEVKQQGKMELDTYEDIIGSIFVVRLLDEDATDEKLFHFFARLCEKMKMMQRLKNHTEYMRLYDELKIKELVLSR